MKILFVIPSLHRAGAERMVVNMCNELIKDERNQIAVFLIFKVNEFGSELDERVIVEGGGISFRFSLYKKDHIENSNYVKFVNEFKPDVIHSQLHFGDLLTYSYFSKDSRYFSHIQNSEIEEYKSINWNKIFSLRTWSNYYEYKWLLKRFKKFNANFIACSAGASKFHNERIRIGKVITLPNASPQKDITETDKKIGETLNLLWVGRMTVVKRPQLAIEIAKGLKKLNIKFKLKMAGSGLETEDCIRLINENGLNNEVEILGLIDNMQPLYDEANLMIHTSVYEGLPLVFTEAMSNGVPIITTDCMPENEIIDDGVNGIMIWDANPNDFVDVITKIVNEPAFYHQLSQKVIETSKKFGMESFVAKMLEFYKN